MYNFIIIAWDWFTAELLANMDFELIYGLARNLGRS